MKFQEGDRFLINKYNTRSESEFVFFLEIESGESIINDQMEINVTYSISFYNHNNTQIRSREALPQDNLTDLDRFNPEDEAYTDRPEVTIDRKECCTHRGEEHSSTFRLIEGFPWQNFIDGYPGSWHCTGCAYTYYPSAVQSLPEQVGDKIIQGDVDYNGEEERVEAWVDQYL